MAAASPPKLYYYAKRRGEAEAIRLLFKELGQPFEDVPVDDAMLRQLRDAGMLLFNDLPMVKFNEGGKAGEFILVESPAILEYIAMLNDTKKKPSAQENAYLGRNEEERSVARALASAAQEFRREMLYFIQNQARPGTKEHFTQKVAPYWLGLLDKLAIASNDGDKGLGPGTDFTFGDMAMFEVVNASTALLKPGILRSYPNLKQWHDDAVRRPAAEKHFASRPDAEW